MKRIFLMAVAVAVALGGTLFSTSCHSDNKPTNVVPADTIADEPMTDVDVIKQYLVDSIGTRYESGEVCIPMLTVIDKQQLDSAENVLADSWVFNFNVVGDTLKCVSGGNHAGRLTLIKDANGNLAVTGFEQVEDGSRYDSSARRIFGDKVDAFWKIHADDKTREQVRDSVIGDYVKSHKLSVKFHQDYGWPAVEIK